MSKLAGLDEMPPDAVTTLTRNWLLFRCGASTMNELSPTAFATLPASGNVVQSTPSFVEYCSAAVAPVSL